ncbi:MAG: deoxyguanosinetriphosphate triphosphohydrolase [Bacteroidales bacterium]|nr:deoxyguanosinetriphosphate triphosphohydrolase [Bacteroidales bacterium]
MDWKELLCSQRFGQEDREPGNWQEIRTEFQRDFDRLIFSAPFRRLQNKTQVFPLPGRVFVHNRLTHSLEVASVGRSIGNLVSRQLTGNMDKEEALLVSEIGSVVAAACLAHDLGNPPFGHSGENAISRFFSEGNGIRFKEVVSKAEWEDLICFEGNANLLRLLTHTFNGRRPGGFAMTYASLAATIKYPFSSMDKGRKNKYGYFQSEAQAFEQIISKTGLHRLNNNLSTQGVCVRHPLVYLVEAADDICYQIMDMEDASKLNILSVNTVHDIYYRFFQNEADRSRLERLEKNFTVVRDANEQTAYLRAMVINKLVSEVADGFVSHYQEIMEGTFHGKMIDMLQPETAKAMNYCAEEAFSKVYNHPSVTKVEITGYNVIGFLLEEFTLAFLKPESDYNKKLLSLMPAQYVEPGTDLYGKLRSVIDFVSGMTDIYAVELYRQIKGIDLV